MPLILERATRDDLTKLHAAYTAGFGPDDPLDNALFPPTVRQAPGYDNDHIRFRFERMAFDIDKPWMHFLKVTDTDTGEVVGMAQWDRPDPANPANTMTEAEQRAESERESANWPASLDKELFRRLKGIIAATADEKLGAERIKDMWRLRLIAVNPKYQRRGIGRMMLRYGTDAAAAEGKDAWMVATAQGMPLYVGNGFTSLAVMDLLTPHNLMYLKTRPEA